MSDRLCKNCERQQKDQYCEVCGVYTTTEAEEQAECDVADRKVEIDRRMIALFSQCFNCPPRS